MSDETTRSISRALEDLALALGEGGAVPRAELVRALERAADRLRTPRRDGVQPTDLISQAAASRLLGVSRQAVNQWVRKGIVPGHVGADSSGRHVQLVSLSEVSVVANRGSRDRFAGSLRAELTAFLSEVEAFPGLGAMARGVTVGLNSQEPGDLSDVGSRVLREFFVGAMGSAVSGEEFTESGVHMLAELAPALQVEETSAGGALLDSLNLLVRSSDGRVGFDSSSAALLGLLGAATVGARLGGRHCAIGRSIEKAAETVWGDAWVDRLFDTAALVDELESPALTRYTASLVYLGCNRFMRQAQVDGVSITYAASPGAILPQSYYGGPVFAELMSGKEPREAAWRFGDLASGSPVPVPDKSGFRVFNFDYGLFDPSIHGIRRYCYDGARAQRELQGFVSGLAGEERTRYLDLVTRTLAQTLQRPFVEMAVVEEPASFDWWKAHLIRASPRETLIGLRGERARSVAHGLLVRSSALPLVLESGDEDNDLRERLRLYVKNLDFDFIEERYRDDRSRGVSRVIKDASEQLDAPEAARRAQAEIAQLLGA